LAAFVVAVSLVAHLAGGGDRPSAGWLGGTCLAVMGAAVLLTPRQLSALRALLAMGIGQVGLHQVFMASTGSSVPVAVVGAPAGMDRSSLHSMMPMGHAAGALAAVEHGGLAQGVSASAAFSPVAMVAWHVVATAVLVAVLVTGERAVWALWRIWSRWAPLTWVLTIAPVRVTVAAPPSDAWLEVSRQRELVTVARDAAPP